MAKLTKAQQEILGVTDEAAAVIDAEAEAVALKDDEETKAIEALLAADEVKETPATPVVAAEPQVEVAPVVEAVVPVEELAPPPEVVEVPVTPVVEEVVAPAPATVYTPAATSPVYTAPAVVAPVNARPAPETAEYVSSMEGQVLDAIKAYIVEMRPGKPVSPADACRHQSSLLRALQTCINRQTTGFESTFTKIHELVRENRKGCFSETHVYRHLDKVSWSDIDLNCFTNIMKMLSMACDPQGREVSLRQLDMGRALKYGITEEGRQRVLSFYGV